MKKLLAIMISLFVLTFLVACQGESESKITEESAKQSIASENVQESEEPEEPEDPEKKEEGLEVINSTKDLVQTSYAENIPWTNDTQQWAIIELDCGPGADWKENRDYYINKYFSDMTREERNNIKHYVEVEHNPYLFIPRYVATNTVTKMYRDWDEDGEEKEGKTLFSVKNGVPFTAEIQEPPFDFDPIYKLKNDVGYEYVQQQDLSGEPPVSNPDEDIFLDLTEWQYFIY